MWILLCDIYDVPAKALIQLCLYVNQKAIYLSHIDVKYGWSNAYSRSSRKWYNFILFFQKVNEVIAWFDTLKNGRVSSVENCCSWEVIFNKRISGKEGNIWINGAISTITNDLAISWVGSAIKFCLASCITCAIVGATKMVNDIVTLLSSLTNSIPAYRSYLHKLTLTVTCITWRWSQAWLTLLWALNDSISTDMGDKLTLIVTIKTCRWS